MICGDVRTLCFAPPAESRQFRFQIRKPAFQLLAVSFVAADCQIVEHTRPVEQETVPFTLHFDLLGI